MMEQDEKITCMKDAIKNFKNPDQSDRTSDERMLKGIDLLENVVKNQEIRYTTDMLRFAIGSQQSQQMKQKKRKRDDDDESAEYYESDEYESDDDEYESDESDDLEEEEDEEEEEEDVTANNDVAVATATVARATTAPAATATTATTAATATTATTASAVINTVATRKKNEPKVVIVEKVVKKVVEKFINKPRKQQSDKGKKRTKKYNTQPREKKPRKKYVSQSKKLSELAKGKGYARTELQQVGATARKGFELTQDALMKTMTNSNMEPGLDENGTQKPSNEAKHRVRYMLIAVSEINPSNPDGSKPKQVKREKPLITRMCAFEEDVPAINRALRESVDFPDRYEVNDIFGIGSVGLNNLKMHREEQKKNEKPRKKRKKSESDHEEKENDHEEKDDGEK